MAYIREVHNNCKTHFFMVVSFFLTCTHLAPGWCASSSCTRLCMRHDWQRRGEKDSRRGQRKRARIVRSVMGISRGWPGHINTTSWVNYVDVHGLEQRRKYCVPIPFKSFRTNKRTNALGMSRERLGM
eukprot:68005-Amphidinium_carterae.1